MKLEQSIEKTSEYHIFSKRYPHLAESIKLKRALQRLNNRLKTEKERSFRSQIKREINVTKTKLRKENILKRLYGESKQEAFFHTHFLLDTSKMYFRKASKKLRRSMHKNLPPTIFDLRALDTADKALALREWIHERRKKLH